MKLKRLLASLGALVIVTSASASLVACGPISSVRGENTQAVSNSITANLNFQTKNWIGESESSLIQGLIKKEAQILLLASQFGLNQDELVKVSGLDTETFLENFDLTSLQTLTKDKRFHQTLGRKGAIFSIFGKDNFEIKNSITNKIINRALGKRHTTGTNYSIEELARTIEYFLDSFYPLMQDVNLARSIKKIGDALNSVGLSSEDTKLAQQEATKIVKSKPVEKYVKPLLSVLVNGVDLSRFANVTPVVFMAQVANEIANLLGYATLENYQPITGDTDQVDKANEVIKNITTKKAWNNFSLEHNPIKIMETGATLVAMLNQLFNIFKTPDVRYDRTNLDDYLFNTSMDNESFLKQLYQNDMKTLVGLDSLKKLNVTELTSNFFYFFDAPTAKEGQYRLQKLFYGLLLRNPGYEFHGTYGLTPLAAFGANVFKDITLIKYPGLQETFMILGDINRRVREVVDSLASNKPLPLKTFFSELMWKGWFQGVGGVKYALNYFDPGLGDKIQNFGLIIQNAFGNHSFEGLCFNDLRPIIQGLNIFINDDKVTQIMKIINKVFGKSTPLGLASLRKLTLNDIFYAFGLIAFKNPHVPNFLPEFTKKTLIQDLTTLEKLFGVYGTDSSRDLKLKKIDFTPLILDAQAWLTIPEGKDKTIFETFIGQLDNPKVALNMLGFNGNPRNGVVRRDSVIGHLLSTFMPRIALGNNPEIILEFYYDDADKIMPIVLDLYSLIKRALAKQDLKPFIKAVMHSSDPFSYAFSETTMFANGYNLKSAKIITYLDPNEIIFDDYSRPNGQKHSITIKVSRNNASEKFKFTELSYR